MKKFMALIEDKFMPLAGIVASNKYLTALRDGMIISMPILIVGSMLLVITEVPIDAYQNFMASVFGGGWKWFSDTGVSATIGLVALFAIIGISSSLAERNKKDSMMAVIIGITSYFIVIVQLEDGGYMLSSFNARSVFTAIIVSMVSTVLYSYILEKDLRIKMPSSVPHAISRSFEALIPAAVIIPFFLAIRYVFTLTSYGSMANFVFSMLQQPLTGVTNTFGGIMIATFMSHLLWFFGIHGASIVGAVAGPMWQVAGFENFEAFKANQQLPNIITQQFNDIFQTYGGVGSTLGLVVIMTFFCKSRQVKTLGKLAIAPSLFGINEPIVFGLPLVMNPILAVPFFLTPLINVTLAYGATALGLIGRTTGVQVTWSMPPIISGILGTNDIRAGVLQLVSIAISLALYYPFIMAYDRRMLKAELEADEAN